MLFSTFSKHLLAQDHLAEIICTNEYLFPTTVWRLTNWFFSENHPPNIYFQGGLGEPETFGVADTGKPTNVSKGLADRLNGWKEV